MYNLPWSDLLQENELPFVNYEDLMVGIVVLAPWKHRGSGIHYSKACVVDAGECVCVCVYTCIDITMWLQLYYLHT